MPSALCKLGTKPCKKLACFSRPADRYEKKSLSSRSPKLTFFPFLPQKSPHCRCPAGGICIGFHPCWKAPASADSFGGALPAICCRRKPSHISIVYKSIFHFSDMKPKLWNHGRFDPDYRRPRQISGRQKGEQHFFYKLFISSKYTNLYFFTVENKICLCDSIITSCG